MLNIKVTVSSLIKINVLIMQKSTEMLQNIVKKWPVEKKIYILLENLTSLEQGVHTILLSCKPDPTNPSVDRFQYHAQVY